ncbi:MAG: hypothetical protein HOV81_01390 [Kofleriaceae bacterium]|nr:hypothetical protein [Kofleriaceae bacterium]
MKIKALITTLVLGTSSVALAAPAVRDHRAPAPVVVAQGNWHRPAPRPMYPVTLASSQKINGRELIRVAASQRAFTKLELRSKAGRTKLDKVMITFANGGTQLIDCNKLLTGSETFSIDLKGNSRNIKSITLVGSSGRRASLDVVAV